jgi:hypothetical protein
MRGNNPGRLLYSDDGVCQSDKATYEHLIDGTVALYEALWECYVGHNLDTIRQIITKLALMQYSNENLREYIKYVADFCCMLPDAEIFTRTAVINIGLAVVAYPNRSSVLDVDFARRALRLVEIKYCDRLTDV